MMDENKKAVEETAVSPLRRIWDSMGYLIVTAVVVLVLFGVILMLAFVPTGSMEPTLPTRSLFIASRLPYTVSDPVPDRGDIVVFDSEELGEILVKRVVGLPGDTVSFGGGYVYINGELLEEEYLTVQGITYPAQEGDVFTVPEDAVFLLGDHRDNSLDSRYWAAPCIPLSDLKGHALVAVSLLPDTAWKGIHWLG